MREKLQYRGKVEVTHKRNSRILKRKIHNTGLPDMSLLFAKAITGNISPIDDLPRLLDIGYVVPNADTQENDYNNGIWMSILNSPVNIGGKQYRYDNSLHNWVAILTSTVASSDLNGALMSDVQANSSSGSGEYQLKARLCSYNKATRKYFAEIDLSYEDIAEIKDKTSAIFTWYTELLYQEENSSTTTISNIDEGESSPVSINPLPLV